MLIKAIRITFVLAIFVFGYLLGGKNTKEFVAFWDDMREIAAKEHHLKTEVEKKYGRIPIVSFLQKIPRKEGKSVEGKYRFAPMGQDNVWILDSQDGYLWVGGIGGIRYLGQVEIGMNVWGPGKLEWEIEELEQLWKGPPYLKRGEYQVLRTYSR